MALTNQIYIRVSDEDKALLDALTKSLNLDGQASTLRKLIRDEADRRALTIQAAQQPSAQAA